MYHSLLAFLLKVKGIGAMYKVRVLVRLAADDDLHLPLNLFVMDSL